MSLMFMHGFSQLFQLPTHVLLLIVLGLCIGQQFGLQQHSTAGRYIAFSIPSLVLSVMLGLILSSQPLPAWPYALLALGLNLIIGIGVILQWRLPLSVVLIFSILGGLILGLSADPLLLPSFSAEKIASVFMGITVAAGLLGAMVTLIATVLQRFWHGLGVRILGSWVTACTLLVLALHWLPITTSIPPST